MTHHQRIAQLREQGVHIPFPEMVAIADDVKLDQIVGPSTTLHPGSYLQGPKLRISAGCEIAAEGPTTVRNCTLGRNASLKGGFFDGAVFLRGANMGLGAHIRPGTLLEEEANGAHTVGLKQTILLPFVTLGSLINLCDLLMAGGTSRRDHSEVGSSFVHFNFTPSGKRGDKATPSLIGDVPKGVMLRSKRIFLGGQAGLVGPAAVDYGTVLAAGTVYRQDHGPDQLVVGEPMAAVVLPFDPNKLNKTKRKVERNLRYIGNLMALWHWYQHVRLTMANGGELVPIYQAAMELLSGAVKERVKQLGRIASYMDDSIAILEKAGRKKAGEIADQRAFADAWPKMEHALSSCCSEQGDAEARQVLLQALDGSQQGDYIATLYALPDQGVQAGTRWLQSIVNHTVRTHMAIFDR